jgi:hypothetical protein
MAGRLFIKDDVSIERFKPRRLEGLMPASFDHNLTADAH